MREIERIFLLRHVDSLWMDHIDAMEDLKSGISLNAYAQRNPVDEYRLQGADMFDEMVETIRERTVRTLLSRVKREEPIRRTEVGKPTTAGFAGDGQKAPVKKAPAVRKEPKVGANDPCPCGSGKKYKKCCGARE